MKNLLLIITLVLLSHNLEAKTCDDKECKNGNPTYMEFKKFVKWGQSSGHRIMANSYSCYSEKYTRNVANYIISHGSVSKRNITASGCYFINMISFAKIVSVSKDKKVCEVLTHRAIYGGEKKVGIHRVFIESRFIQSTIQQKREKF